MGSKDGGGHRINRKISIIVVLLMIFTMAMPVSVLGTSATTSVLAGGYYSGYALKSDGTVWSWGRGDYGQLGNGSTTQSNVPVQVSNLTGVVAIAGGYYSGYALKSDGTVWSWGRGDYGQLGNGSTTQSNVPVQVSNLTGVVAIAGGHRSGYALKSDGTVWSWGYNNNGQLGNNSTIQSNVPVQVSNLTGVVAIAGGYNSGYALKSDGTVWAWGYNNNGQLGNNSTTDSKIPVQVSNLTGVVAIAGGYYSGYALKSDGTVWAWGHNGYGQLGNNSTIQSNVPVQVSNLTGVVAIAGGGYSGYALKSDGTVWSWGRGDYGQLGNGSTTQSNVPVQVSNLTGVVAIAGGFGSGYALKSGGTVWSWGRGDYGQLGNGSTTQSNVPVQVSNLNLEISTGTPLAPDGLQALNITSNSLDLSWSASDGATSYIVYQDGNQIATTTDTTYHITNLNPNTTYSFQIIAVYDNGQSPLSDAISVTTLGVPPMPPTGLSAGDITLTSFTLYWFRQPDATSYNVYMDGTLVGNVPQTLIFNPSFDFENLTEGSTYVMTVTAVNEWGESEASQPLPVTASVQNPVLKATVKNDKINLTWTGYGNSFDILLDGEIITQVTESSYTLTKEPGTYKVQIIQNYNGKQYPSNVVTVKVSALQTVEPAQMSGDIVKNTGLVLAPAGGLLALGLALKAGPLLIAAVKAFFLKS